MIKKILQIKNFGKFISPTFGKENWNGIFDQTNVIYANNGSGKTTLSLLFRSLKGRNELVNKKKSFSATENPEIILLEENNKEIKYTKNKWSRFQKDIEIFDSFYIEDNVYIITIKEDLNTPNFFEILLGEESIKIRKKIDGLKEQIKKLSNKRTSLKYKRTHTEDEKIKADFEKKINDNVAIAEKTKKQILKLESNILELSSCHREEYLQKINSYLRMFSPNLQLGKILDKGFRAVYILQISGHELKNSVTSNYSFRYSLSEGDKNALSLSFFLARLDMLPNLNDFTVIIDDPITSFDYSRKNTTINNLVSLSRKVKQFILLTHDLTFANDFSRKLNYDCNNLKIDFNGTTSHIIKHDIERESLTGVFKDLTVLHEYLANGAANDTERRDIARCIRPVLEGIFRIKFFREIQRTEWLGDIIGKIRNSSPPSIFDNYKSFVPELSEINDYSKDYHHSNPYNFETPINDQELRNYVARTIELLHKI